MEQNYTVLKCEIDLDKNFKPFVNFIFTNNEDGQTNHAEIPYLIDYYNNRVKLNREVITTLSNDFGLRPTNKLIDDIEKMASFNMMPVGTKIGLLKKFIYGLRTSPFGDVSTKVDLCLFCDHMTKSETKYKLLKGK